MKNKVYRFCVLIILTSISYSSTAQHRNIPLKDIPQPITTYLKTHFPNNAVLKASFDDHTVYKKYEIELKNKISLEFNPQFTVREIKSKSKLPDSVIPEKILKYVKSNYPKNSISDWELDKGIQKIELNNGYDLEFNLNGEFIRIEK